MATYSRTRRGTSLEDIGCALAWRGMGSARLKIQNFATIRTHQELIRGDPGSSTRLQNMEANDGQLNTLAPKRLLLGLRSKEKDNCFKARCVACQGFVHSGGPIIGIAAGYR